MPHQLEIPGSALTGCPGMTGLMERSDQFERPATSTHSHGAGVSIAIRASTSMRGRITAA